MAADDGEGNRVSVESGEGNRIHVDSLPGKLREVVQRVMASEDGTVSESALARVVEQAGKKSRFHNSTFLRAFSVPGKQVIESSDLESAAQQKMELQSRQHMFTRMIFALLGSLVLLSLATFGVSFAAVEIAKDMHVGGDRVVRTDDGTVALIGSADVMVSNGMLLQRQDVESCSGGNCRRLTEGAAHALVTGTAQERRTLTSRIADEVFQNLDKVTLHLTEGDGINTEVTLRVHGFMRTRKVPSLCGTIVRLDMLEGTIILDDSDIHLDARLVEHFSNSGLALGETSAYGRRLQMTSTDVLGIFSHFDDIEVRCATDDSPKPQSPKLPYLTTLLEKRPCIAGTFDCASSIFPDQDLKRPGYDAATDSVWTLVRALIAEDYSITFSSWPNYPGQELVTVTDNVQQTTHQYQLHDNEVTVCWNETYYPLAAMNESDWHIVYLGETTRAETVVDYLGASFTVPASTNRVFRVRSNNDTTEKVIEYEDDSITKMPRRMFMHQARDAHLETEEVLTLELTELEQSAADLLRREYSSSLTCSEELQELSEYPRMENPFEESIEAVQFFVRDLQEDPDSPSAVDSYWAYAIENLNEEVVDAFNNQSDNNRRLGMEKRKCGPSSDNPDVYIPFSSEDCIAIDIDTSYGVCVGVSTSSGGVSPWTITGGITAGQCGSTQFSANGYVRLSYGWSIDLGWFFKAGFSIYGELGVSTKAFSYTHYGHSCPSRRLLEDEDEAACNETKDHVEEDDDQQETIAAAADETHEDSDLSSPSSAEDTQLVAAEDGAQLMEGDVEGRRLWWSRRRRRRAPPPPSVTCHKWGVQFYAAIGVEGWASVIGIGASVSGQLTITFGPFPKPPLAGSVKLTLSGKACVKVWWWKTCASFSIPIR